MTVPLWVFQSLVGFAAIQLLAFAGWAVRVHLQLNSLTAFKNEVEKAGTLDGHDLTDIKTQQAVQKEQTAMILTALGKLEAKVDTLIEKVAKQDGRAGRSS